MDGTATDVRTNHGTTHQTAAEVAAVSEQLVALRRQVDALAGWDDRLGSAVKRAWHWRLTTFLLLLINGVLAWYAVQLRPDILPYLYVVDPQGQVLWSGMPGAYEVKDTWIIAHLEDWIKAVFGRDPELVLVARAWDQAVKMTPPMSACRERLNTYMREQDPRRLPRLPRTEVRILTPKVLDRQTTSGHYRISWQELRYGSAGQVNSQPIYEADFRVELKPPKTAAEAATSRYGILLSECSWAERPGVTP